MPVRHDFECSSGHLTEKVVDAATDIRPKRCGFEGCKRLAEKVHLPRRFAHAQATVVFRAPDGHFEFPGRGDHPTPKGFDRVEIAPHEIRSFERQMNREISSKESRLREMDQRSAEHHRDIRHSDLRNVIPQMDNFHRDLAHAAMQGEQAGYSKQYSPDFRVKAYE